MRLTPLDIKKQEFARTLRGFDMEEVQAFLDVMARQWQDLQDDHRRLEDKVREAESKLTHYQQVEMALQEALQTTRQSSKQTLENAKQQARLLIKEAQAKAEDIKHDAVKTRDTLEHDVKVLTKRRDEIVAQLRGFLMSEVELLSRFDGGDLMGRRLLHASDEAAPAVKATPPKMETAQYELAEDAQEVRTPLDDLMAPDEEEGDTEAFYAAMESLNSPEAVADEDVEAAAPSDEDAWYFSGGDEAEAGEDEPEPVVAQEADDEALSFRFFEADAAEPDDNNLSQLIFEDAAVLPIEDEGTEAFPYEELQHRLSKIGNGTEEAGGDNAPDADTSEPALAEPGKGKKADSIPANDGRPAAEEIEKLRRILSDLE